VERHVQPGLTRLNWNSLGIEEYSRECHQILKNLASLVAQMESLGKEVQAIINCLEEFDFFYFDKSEGGTARPSCRVNTPKVIYRDVRFKYKTSNFIFVMWV
jgi:dynein heavy chain